MAFPPLVALVGVMGRHPDRVERLVLVSPVGIPRPPPGDRHANLSFGIRMLLGFFSKIWAWGVTPQDLVRGAGGWGYDLIAKYVSARFTGMCTVLDSTARHPAEHSVRRVEREHRVDPVHGTQCTPCRAQYTPCRGNTCTPCGERTECTPFCRCTLLLGLYDCERSGAALCHRRRGQAGDD